VQLKFLVTKCIWRDNYVSADEGACVNTAAWFLRNYSGSCKQMDSVTIFSVRKIKWKSLWNTHAAKGTLNFLNSWNQVFLICDSCLYELVPTFCQSEGQIIVYIRQIEVQFSDLFNTVNRQLESMKIFRKSLFLVCTFIFNACVIRSNYLTSNIMVIS
jgi:hypothetical protein